MTQLTPNFALEEFRKDINAPIPAACVDALTILCEEILEPVRDWCNCSLIITSGYRSPESNAAAHGQPNSEHVATSDLCAADFYPAMISARTVFDWMRNNPALPYHQLILEHGHSGGSVIHVSWNKQKPGIRSVLEGATNNASPYTHCNCVAYQPGGDDQKSQDSKWPNG